MEERFSREAFCRVSRYTLSPKAQRDIFQHWIYISKDSADSADNVEAAIYRNCELLVQNSGVGRPSLKRMSPPVFTWPALPYENYLIFYRVTSRGIRVIRILRAERNLRRLP